MSIGKGEKLHDDDEANFLGKGRRGQAKCYAVSNSNFSFVIWGNRTGAKNFSEYKWGI